MTTSLRRMASIESRPANRLSLYVDSQTSASAAMHGVQKLNNEWNTMKTKKLVEKVAVPSESKGICGAIARLMRRRSVIDIVERFQRKHALQEERETKNFHPSMNGVIAPGIIRF